MVETHLIPSFVHARPASDLAHMIDCSEIESLFIMFLYNCKSRGLSEKSQKDYQQNFGQFVHFCVGKKLTDPNGIVDTHIDIFLCIKQQTCKAVSVADYYRCIKRFFNWLVKKKIVKISPMDSMDPPKVPKIIPEPFKVDHIRMLLAQCDLIDSQFENIRNKAIVLTFLDTGLRLAELTNITLDDIDEDSEIIKVLGKGAKERL